MRWKRDRLPTPVFLGFCCGSAGKESTCNMVDLGSIPGLERSLGEGKGYPLQYSGLENSMTSLVHEIAKSQMWMSDFHFTLCQTSTWQLTHTVSLDPDDNIVSRYYYLCFHKWGDSLRVDKLAQAHTASTWGISYLNRVLPGSKACDLSVDTFQGPRPVVMCLVRSYFHLLIQAVSHSFNEQTFINCLLCVRHCAGLWRVNKDD